MQTIGPLRRTSIDTAAVTMERAFLSDPLFIWVFPRSATRATALRTFMRGGLEYGVRYGRVTSAHDAKAVSIWVPPGPGLTMPRMVRSGFFGLPFRIGFGPFARFIGANEVMDKIHKRGVPEPHWYLMLVGVDPELQGRGVGSALVKEGLIQADRGGFPCYLETSEKRNLAFYERHGFFVLEETVLGKGGPVAWAMRREPQGDSIATGAQP